MGNLMFAVRLDVHVRWFRKLMCMCVGCLFEIVQSLAISRNIRVRRSYLYSMVYVMGFHRYEQPLSVQTGMRLCSITYSPP